MTAPEFGYPQYRHRIPSGGRVATLHEGTVDHDSIFEDTVLQRVAPAVGSTTDEALFAERFIRSVKYFI